MKYHKFTSKTLFPNRNYAPVLSVFQRVSTDRCLSPYRQRLFPFSLSEYQLSTTPQACVIIPDLLLLHTVGEEGERVREAPQGSERERERRDKDVKVETERGAAPCDKAVAMPKSQEHSKDTQQHTCTQSKQGRGGWWELECHNGVTQDGRSILTALTVRTARARQQGRPQEMGEGRCDGRHEEKMFSTSTRIASPSPPPSCSLTLHVRMSAQPKRFRHGGTRTKWGCCYFSALGDGISERNF